MQAAWVEGGSAGWVDFASHPDTSRQALPPFARQEWLKWFRTMSAFITLDRGNTLSPLQI